MLNMLLLAAAAWTAISFLFVLAIGNWRFHKRDMQSPGACLYCMGAEAFDVHIPVQWPNPS